MRILTIKNVDKKNIKLINQTIYGFELFLTGEKIKEITDFISDCKKNNQEIHIAWQTKFKSYNFVLYKNCTFSDVKDYSYIFVKPNYKFYTKITVHEYYSKIDEYQYKYEIVSNNGIKIKVNVGEFVNHYSTISKGKKLKGSKNSKTSYKDRLLLDRMLKINKIDFNNQ